MKTLLLVLGMMSVTAPLKDNPSPVNAKIEFQIPESLFTQSHSSLYNSGGNLISSVTLIMDPNNDVNRNNNFGDLTLQLNHNNPNECILTILKRSNRNTLGHYTYNVDLKKRIATIDCDKSKNSDTNWYGSKTLDLTDEQYQQLQQISDVQAKMLKDQNEASANRHAMNMNIFNKVTTDGSKVILIDSLLKNEALLEIVALLSKKPEKIEEVKSALTNNSTSVIAWQNKKTKGSKINNNHRH